jgi:hypothetical protein
MKPLIPMLQTPPYVSLFHFPNFQARLLDFEFVDVVIFLFELLESAKNCLHFSNFALLEAM